MTLDKNLRLPRSEVEVMTGAAVRFPIMERGCGGPGSD